MYQIGDLNSFLTKTGGNVKNSDKKKNVKLAGLFSGQIEAPQLPTLSDSLITQHKKAADEKTDIITKVKKKKLSKKEIEDENKRTVFVGNLPNTITEKKIAKIFKVAGAIDSVRIRSMARSDPTSRRKLAAIKKEFHPDMKTVNAYVRFKNENSVKLALKLNGEKIGDYHLRVDTVSGATFRDNKKCIFVGNLDFKIDEEKVRSHFEDCGQIDSVRVIRDRATRLGKGFGYVQFKESYSVELSLKLNNSELEGRAVRVTRCQNSDKINSGKKGKDYKHKQNSKKNAVEATKRIQEKKAKITKKKK